VGREDKYSETQWLICCDASGSRRRRRRRRPL